jgi:sterol desaturase/sphingolipid hydroxylase (fatty acid hydroxylase superfamily)
MTVNQGVEAVSHKQGAAIRSRVDYIIIALFYVILYQVGNKFWPGNSTKQDTDYFQNLFAQLGYYASFGYAGSDPSTWANFISTWVAFFFLTVLGEAFITYGLCWNYLIWMWPDTPRKYFAIQSRDLLLSNFWLLAAYQTVFDWMVVKGYTKQTAGNTDAFSVVRDIALWSLVFELTWYTQHRLMHEKFLWELKIFGFEFGHSYHHQWRDNYQMIGITNFSFDALVETWVTMSSSLLPILLFPSNFYAAKGWSLFYMLWAVLVHHHGFAERFHEMHLGHHHFINKNFGSHFPFFDMIFGTYSWEGIDFDRRRRDMKLVPATLSVSAARAEHEEEVENLVQRAKKATRSASAAKKKKN